LHRLSVLCRFFGAPFSNNYSTVQMQPARRGPGNGIYRAYWAFFQMLLADLGGARTENPYEANLFFIPSQTCGSPPACSLGCGTNLNPED